MSFASVIEGANLWAVGVQKGKFYESCARERVSGWSECCVSWNLYSANVIWNFMKLFCAIIVNLSIFAMSDRDCIFIISNEYLIM